MSISGERALRGAPAPFPSRLVRTRERELGVEIFMRTGGPNSGTLTVAGNGAFVAAEEILHILEIGLRELEV